MSAPEAEPSNKPAGADAPAGDAVDNPTHYTSHPSGVECIQVAEHFGFNLGNVIKYAWRAGLKGSAIEDLQKAKWYLTREIVKRQKEAHDYTAETLEEWAKRSKALLDKTAEGLGIDPRKEPEPLPKFTATGRACPVCAHHVLKVLGGDYCCKNCGWRSRNPPVAQITRKR